MHSSGDEVIEEEVIEEELRKEGTGGQGISPSYKDIIYLFGKYEIKVRLTPDNEFIGIIEVKVNKNFLSYKQKLTPNSFHDVEEFYRE